MGMKSQHLQAMFARKREMEHTHAERTQAVHNYYDHWGKVTARFENWSAPEYYKQADEKLQQTKDAKLKEKTLETRREKLTQLLMSERAQYDLEVKEKQNWRKSKTQNPSTLAKINEKLKGEQALRRQLELEAKLYGKWRHGVDDDNLVFESKSDNEVLAKLNWLDKQVEQQLQREKEEREAHERELRLQEELNKAEQLHKERQMIREQEIQEIRALQEMHMKLLKEKQKESADLKDQEDKYRSNLSDVEKEVELLDESYTQLLQPADFGGAYNLTKIKVYMRKRSELYRNHIKLCVSILNRLSDGALKPEPLNALKEKLANQLDSEMYQLKQIDAMYESEAKYNLQKCEELWKLHSGERYNDVKNVLHGEHIAGRKVLNDILEKQNDVIDIRATHLNVIENTSEKLKQLIKEEEDSPRPYACGHRPIGGGCKKMVTFSPSPRDDQCSPNSPRSVSEYQPTNMNTEPSCRENCACGYYNHTPINDTPIDETHVSNSFSNLNLDSYENNANAQHDFDAMRVGSQRPMQVAPTGNAERPKFGRRRVAWT